jgi:hypothetical protein
MKRRTIFSLVLSFTSTCSVLAIPITGEVSFDGTITFNSTDVATATTIASFENERVSASTQVGSYAPIPDNTLATFAEPINFTTFSGPLAELWKVTSGGLTYSFDLNSLAVIFQGPGFLNLSGQGMARITGFDPTPGVWRLTAQEGNQRFSFSASSAVVSTGVPDGGSTLILMGVGVMSLALLRHKLS